LTHTFQTDIGLKKEFVGLRNFGATCYMNSLMQQIFMMPDLRAGLLDSDVRL
jgi:ubiquitin C-terminal hydrolase